MVDTDIPDHTIFLADPAGFDPDHDDSDLDALFDELFPELPDVGDISDESRYGRETRLAERHEALQEEAEFRRKSKDL